MAKARVPSVSDHRTLSALPAMLMNTHSGTAIHTDSPGFLRLRASREVCVCQRGAVRYRWADVSHLPSEAAVGGKSKGNRLCYSLSLVILALFKKEEKTKHRVGLRSISDGQLGQLHLRHIQALTCPGPKINVWVYQNPWMETKSNLK